MKLRLPRFAYTSLLIVLLLALPVAAQDDVLTLDAYVNTVSINADTTPIIVSVSGDLADPCTTLTDITQTMTDSTIDIHIASERPVDAVCAMVLEPFETDIELDAADLSAGDYTVSVNGVEASFTYVPMAALMPEVTPEATEVVEPPSCPEVDDESQALYENDVLCFLYPADYLLIENEFLLLIDQNTNNDDEARATLLLLLAYDQADSLAAVKVELLADNADLTLEETTLATFPAIVSDELPAFRGSRRGFILNNGDLYGLDAQPNSADYPDSTAVMDDLWEMVTGTLVFK